MCQYKQRGSPGSHWAAQVQLKTYLEPSQTWECRRGNHICVYQVVIYKSCSFILLPNVPNHASHEESKEVDEPKSLCPSPRKTKQHLGDKGRKESANTKVFFRNSSHWQETKPTENCLLLKKKKYLAICARVYPPYMGDKLIPPLMTGILLKNQHETSTHPPGWNLIESYLRHVCGQWGFTGSKDL